MNIATSSGSTTVNRRSAGAPAQPFPDARLGLGDPADAAQQRAGLRLALVAALQLLPARQRAALVLREVLQLPAAEVALFPLFGLPVVMRS